MIVLDKATNTKLYPVGRFENIQHKVYYFITKAENRREDAYSENDLDTIELLENKLANYRKILESVENGVHTDGLVYMPYLVGQELKELVAEYDALH